MRRMRIGAVLAIWLCAGATALAQPPVSIGYVLAGDLITAFVAKEQNFFAQQGLDARLVKLPLATDIPPGLVSGTLDIGMSTPAIVLQAASGGLPFVSVAGISRFFADNPKISVVGRAGTHIAGAAGLRGKRVGVPGLNSNADVGLRAWLLRNGVRQNEVTFVEAALPSMHDMLASGSVDAVAVLEPFRGRIMSDGTGYKIADYYAEISPDALSAVWIATPDWARAHPKQIDAFRAGLREAASWMPAHEAETKAIEKKYLGYNSPMPPSISLDVKPADFAFFEKAMTELGMIDKPVDVNALVWP